MDTEEQKQKDRDYYEKLKEEESSSNNSADFINTVIIPAIIIPSVTSF